MAKPDRDTSARRPAARGHRPKCRLPAGLTARLSALALVALAAAPVAAEELPDQLRQIMVDPSAAASDSLGRVQLDKFLDRLMLAESGGRDDARNARSTAVGAFQFIERTFLDVTRRHFATETASLTPVQVLQLRSNRAFARRAAEAFTRDNARELGSAGLAATFANLRLAFLVGPGGAIRVLKAEARTPAISILGANVVQANPFMAGMTTADLAAWAGRNLAAGDLASGRLAAIAGSVAQAPPAKPRLEAHCDQARASCRRWIALARSRIEGMQTVRVGARGRATAKRIPRVRPDA